MPLIPCNEQNPLKNTIDIFFSILPEYPPLALLTFFFHSCITCMYVNKQKLYITTTTTTDAAAIHVN